MIMIARVLYGLASQGNLPKHLAHVNQTTRTPIVATGYAVVAILILTIAVSLDGLADLASQGTLIIFAAINLALIVIKARNEDAPTGVFLCPRWMPYAGLISSSLVFLVSLLS